MMTKEEIIELAEKAGIIPLENATNALGKSVPLDWLIEFSKLVRADYGKLHASLWLKRIDDAVKKEREECAKTCENIALGLTKWPESFEGLTAETKLMRSMGEFVHKPFVDAIRARK